MVEFDLVITDGTIADGTGQPRFKGHLGIRDGRIAAVARGEPLGGSQMLDAAGLVVAPGFIDVHSHGDWILSLVDHDEILAPLVLQGVTTLVTGQCGFSAAPVTEGAIPLIDAFSELARQAGVRLQLSRQIFVGRRTWRTHHTVLRDVEQATDDGLDVALDAFPYTFDNTTVNAVFPEEENRS